MIIYHYNWNSFEPMSMINRIQNIQFKNHLCSKHSHIHFTYYFGLYLWRQNHLNICFLLLIPFSPSRCHYNYLSVCIFSILICSFFIAIVWFATYHRYTYKLQICFICVYEIYFKLHICKIHLVHYAYIFKKIPFYIIIFHGWVQRW